MSLPLAPSASDKNVKVEKTTTDLTLPSTVHTHSSEKVYTLQVEHHLISMPNASRAIAPKVLDIACVNVSGPRWKIYVKATVGEETKRTLYIFR
jgi:hypothetical protein